MSPVTDISEWQIRDFFRKEETGIPTYVRIFGGRDVKGKPEHNSYAIVQFAHENSALRALHIASKKKNFINSRKVRIYRLMTQFEVSQVKKETKNTDKSSVSFSNARGGGRGRGANRGRGGR